jgi:hypothetical protein
MFRDDGPERLSSIELAGYRPGERIVKTRIAADRPIERMEQISENDWKRAIVSSGDAIRRAPGDRNRCLAELNDTWIWDKGKS